MAFNLDDYEPVAARLSRWLEIPSQAPKRVITHLMQYTDARCVFKAELWHGDVLTSTGWAEETRGEGHVNRTSHFENCETSAIGRALANAGLAGSDYTKRPSREEMLKVERSTAPDPWPADTNTNVVPINQVGQASIKQVNFINTLCKQKGLSTDDITDIMRKLRADHNATFADLTSKEASALIKSLQA
jgi:hypothetical protein